MLFVFVFLKCLVSYFQLEWTAATLSFITESDGEAGHYCMRCEIFTNERAPLASWHACSHRCLIFVTCKLFFLINFPNSNRTWDTYLKRQLTVQLFLASYELRSNLEIERQAWVMNTEMADWQRDKKGNIYTCLAMQLPDRYKCQESEGNRDKINI